MLAAIAGAARGCTRVRTARRARQARARVRARARRPRRVARRARSRGRGPAARAHRDRARRRGARARRVRHRRRRRDRRDRARARDARRVSRRDLRRVARESHRHPRARARAADRGPRRRRGRARRARRSSARTLASDRAWLEHGTDVACHAPLVAVGAVRVRRRVRARVPPRMAAARARRDRGARPVGCARRGARARDRRPRRDLRSRRLGDRSRLRAPARRPSLRGDRVRVARGRAARRERRPIAGTARACSARGSSIPASCIRSRTTTCRCSSRARAGWPASRRPRCSCCCSSRRPARSRASRTATRAARIAVAGSSRSCSACSRIYQPLASLGVLPLTGISWPGLGIDSPSDLWLFVIAIAWCALGAEDHGDRRRARPQHRARRARTPDRARRARDHRVRRRRSSSRGPPSVALARVPADDARIAAALDYGTDGRVPVARADRRARDAGPRCARRRADRCRHDALRSRAPRRVRDRSHRACSARSTACGTAPPATGDCRATGDTCTAVFHAGGPELRLAITRDDRATCTIAGDDEPALALRGRGNAHARPADPRRRRGARCGRARSRAS